MSVATTLQNLRIGLKRRQSGKSKVPAKQRGNWPKMCQKLKDHERAMLFSPSKKRCLPASNLTPEERGFVVDSGASMHMISKKGLEWCWNGYFDETVQSYDSHNRQWRSANAWRGNCVCQRIGKILDYESPREHVSSIVARKALRWKQVFLWMDQWSKITSHQKRESDALQYGELRSYCGSGLVKFVLWIFIDFKNTFETIFLSLIFFTNSKWNSDLRAGKCTWQWHLSSASVWVGWW